MQQQMQQNQLMLSLNQSYFQLVTNQTALAERFNRLEQVILGKSCIADSGSIASRQSPLNCRSNLQQNRASLSHEDCTPVEAVAPQTSANLHAGMTASFTDEHYS